MTEPRIILTRGLPGSGKTTWAKITASDPDGNIVRVSRDDIRMQMFGKYHGVDEDTVTSVENAMVRAALGAGKTVIIDAMHLQQRYINGWQRLGYPIEIVEFNATLDDLLERNLKRDKQVPASFIHSTHTKFVNKDGTLKKVKLSPEQYVTSDLPKYDTMRQAWAPEAYIFDIDGTLAHNDGHRSFYDYSAVYNDKVHYHVASVANSLEEMHNIIIVTGRKAEALEDTISWLVDNNIRYDEIYSRADGDDRPDSIVKYEILRDDIAPHFDVLGVFDDRPSVCEMWRSIGIPTFQVGDPEVRF